MVLCKLDSKSQVQTFKNGIVIAGCRENQGKPRAPQKLISNSDYTLYFMQITYDKAVCGNTNCINGE